MKKITRILGLGLALLGVVSLSSCGEKNAIIEKEDITVNPTSNSIYVKKVENMPDDFILGMDASSVISLEEGGVKYYNFDGEEQDVFKTLAENGVNYIRVRIWNDPYDSLGHGYGGGNNDINKAIEIGKRATKYGMKLLVNFHYSDFWADPAKQMVPKAWANFESMNSYDITSKDSSPKSVALYEYTKDSLNKLKKEGIEIGMVQIGNETNAKMCGETNWINIQSLFRMGAKAVREVCPDALVALHFANPEKTSNYEDYAKKLKYYDVDYDVFASSYYPYWHGTLDNLANILSTIATKYNKKTMVMETSYAYTTEDTDFFGNTIGTSGYDNKDYPFTIQGQINNFRNIVDTIVNKTTNGIGVCYWEGTWISSGGATYEENKELWEKYGSGWATSYAKEYDPNDAGLWYGGCAVDNQAFFDQTGHPLESLKMFGLLKNGNVIDLFADGVEDANVIHYTDEDFTLPETVNVIFCDNSKSPVQVTWEDFDIEAAKKAGNSKYKIKGLASGKEVYCNLTIMEYNYLQNYSFEDNNKSWELNTYDGALDANSYKVQVTSENPQTGKNAFHFWASTADTVKFSIEQEITNLKTGTYKLQFSLLGGVASGTADASQQNIYCYVKINDSIVYKIDAKFTSYSDGYKDFVLKNIEYTQGDKIVIGVYVEANEVGSWGDVDDILFNYQNE